MTVRADIRDLFTFRDSPVRWPVAVQAALAMGLPVAIFAALGQPQLGLMASTGGFTALYLAGRSRRERARLLPLIAAGLLASASLGVLSSGSLLASFACLFLLVVASAIVTLGFGVGPPGSLFFMLLAGVSIRLTAPKALGGDELSGVLVVGMIAVGCAIAYLLVLVPLAIPSVRKRDTALHSERIRMRFRFDEDTRVIVFRVTLASAVAILVAAPLGVHRVYWVLLTVIAILQNGRRLRLTALRGIHRVLGTLVGVGLFALVLLAHPEGLLLALLLAVLQFIVELVVIRNYGLALVFITPLALIIAAQGQPADVGGVVVTRLLDTLLGAGIAMAVLLVALVVRYPRRPAS
ncbi:MAG TPA: FUSC family protein [Galbitalea sp.]